MSTELMKRAAMNLSKSLIETELADFTLPDLRSMTSLLQSLV